MHGGPVYLGTQLYIYTSPPFVLTYASIMLDLSKSEKKNLGGGPIKLIISMDLKVSLMIYG